MTDTDQAIALLLDSVAYAAVMWTFDSLWEAGKDWAAIMCHLDLLLCSQDIRLGSSMHHPVKHGRDKT